MTTDGTSPLAVITHGQMRFKSGLGIRRSVQRASALALAIPAPFLWMMAIRIRM